MIRLTGFVGRTMYIAKLNSEVTVKHHTPEHKIDKIINTAHTHARAHPFSTTHGATVGAVAGLMPFSFFFQFVASYRLLPPSDHVSFFVFLQIFVWLFAIFEVHFLRSAQSIWIVADDATQGKREEDKKRYNICTNVNKMYKSCYFLWFRIAARTWLYWYRTATCARGQQRDRRRRNKTRTTTTKRTNCGRLRLVFAIRIYCASHTQTATGHSQPQTCTHRHDKIAPLYWCRCFSRSFFSCFFFFLFLFRTAHETWISAVAIAIE